MIREGVFNHANRFTIYIKKKSNKGEFEDIFIFDSRSKLGNVSILAQSGKLLSRDNKWFLLLKGGLRHELDRQTRKISSFSFEEFLYDLTDHITDKQIRAVKPNEKTLAQLLNPDETIIEDMKRSFRVEAHQRILLPFLSIVDALIVIFSFIYTSLSRYRLKFFCTAMSLLIMHVLVIASVNASYKSINALIFSYGLVISCIALGTFYIGINFFREYLLLKKFAK